MKKFKVRLAKRCLNIMFGVESVPLKPVRYRVWVRTRAGLNWVSFNNLATAKRWAETHVVSKNDYYIEETKVIIGHEEV